MTDNTDLIAEARDYVANAVDGLAPIPYGLVTSLADALEARDAEIEWLRDDLDALRAATFEATE